MRILLALFGLCPLVAFSFPSQKDVVEPIIAGEELEAQPIITVTKLFDSSKTAQVHAPSTLDTSASNPQFVNHVVLFYDKTTGQLTASAGSHQSEEAALKRMNEMSVELNVRDMNALAMATEVVLEPFIAHLFPNGPYNWHAKALARLFIFQFGLRELSAVERARNVTETIAFMHNATAQQSKAVIDLLMHTVDEFFSKAEVLAAHHGSESLELYDNLTDILKTAEYTVDDVEQKIRDLFFEHISNYPELDAFSKSIDVLLVEMVNTHASSSTPSPLPVDSPNYDPVEASNVIFYIPISSRIVSSSESVQSTIKLNVLHLNGLALIGDPVDVLVRLFPEMDELYAAFGLMEDFLTKGLTAEERALKVAHRISTSPDRDTANAVLTRLVAWMEKVFNEIPALLAHFGPVTKTVVRQFFDILGNSTFTTQDISRRVHKLLSIFTEDDLAAVTELSIFSKMLREKILESATDLSLLSISSPAPSAPAPKDTHMFYYDPKTNRIIPPSESTASTIKFSVLHMNMIGPSQDTPIYRNTLELLFTNTSELFGALKIISMFAEKGLTAEERAEKVAVFTASEDSQRELAKSALAKLATFMEHFVNEIMESSTKLGPHSRLFIQQLGSILSAPENTIEDLAQQIPPLSAAYFPSDELYEFAKTVFCSMIEWSSHFNFLTSPSPIPTTSSPNPMEKYEEAEEPFEGWLPL